MVGINTNGFGDLLSLQNASINILSSVKNCTVQYIIENTLYVYSCHRDLSVEADQAGPKMSTASLDSIESSKERPLSRRSSLHSLPELDGRCQLLLSVCLSVCLSACVFESFKEHNKCLLYCTSSM